MDNHNAENRSEVLSTLLAGFNEFTRSAYIQGFKDGQEFEVKIREHEANNSDLNSVSDLKNDLNPVKARSLKEAELILMEYS